MHELPTAQHATTASREQAPPAFLIGGEAFLARFRHDVAAAQESILLQAMTFQADRAGAAVFDCITQATAPKKHVLMDDYSRVVVSDTFAVLPASVLPRPFQTLVRDTRELPTRFRAHGVKVTVTNPIAGRPWRYPARNHKKLAVIDRRIVYLGGINISDHNFAWFDAMLRIESEQLGSCCADDIAATAGGRNQSAVQETDVGRLYLFDGLRSRALYRELFASVDRARSSIVVVSPYVSDPLLAALEARRNRDVPVTLVTPGVNNKNLFRTLLLAEQGRGYFRLLEQPGLMSHVKAVCIDGKELWFGSSNFDHASYCFEQEVVLQTTHRDILEAFRQSVLSTVLSSAREVPRPARTASVSRAPRQIFRAVIWLLEQLAH